jgi:hypothetical protein
VSTNLREARRWLEIAEVGLLRKDSMSASWDQQRALWQLLLHLEAQQSLAPHRHRMFPGATGPATGPAEAMPPSSLDTEPTEDGSSGSSTSFKSWHLVKEDRSGELPITATVTLPASSSIETRGNVLKPLLEHGFVLKTLTTWGSPLPSGVTQSTTQEPVAAGPIAGGNSDPTNLNAAEEQARVAKEGLEELRVTIAIYTEGDIRNILQGAVDLTLDRISALSQEQEHPHDD